jgi:hypothetical protein
MQRRAAAIEGFGTFANKFYRYEELYTPGAQPDWRIASRG